ncbi:MAG: tetratricopeptide repeat protein [Pseudomonadota bacterium]
MIRFAAALAAVLALTGCAGLLPARVDIEEERKQAAANPLEQESLNEIMLSVAGSEEAVTYFRDALARNPEDAGLRRAYARALYRNRQFAEAGFVYRSLDEAGEATDLDRVNYALALARLEQWDEAEAQLALLPPSARSSRQSLARALIADQRRNWDAADAAYAEAQALAPQPASVLNNWGVSRMARGEMNAAQRSFEEALIYDPEMFSAKNNLAIAYGLQRRYRVPLVSLTDEERAVILHNLGVIALRQGDRDIGQGLLEQSLATHPQHYAPAADKLAALGGVGG